MTFGLLFSSNLLSFSCPLPVSHKNKQLPWLLFESPRRQAADNHPKYFYSGHAVACPWLGGASCSISFVFCPAEAYG
jgi:hypothetical protein